MQKKLKEGGFLIWIAPAGGRDRRQEDGTLIPDKFDPQAIEMMKKLGTKNSSAKTHYYPLAMVLQFFCALHFLKELSRLLMILCHHLLSQRRTLARSG
jgi:hypothetical protein